MEIEKYLDNFDRSSVTLVGPMLCKKRSFSNPTLYIDGGANARHENHGFSIGDNDSFQGKLDQVLPTEKEYSDLAFALSHCKKFDKIHLHGFLGGRKDHELLNFGEVHHHFKLQTQKEAIFDDEIIVFSKGEWELELKQDFSLICLEPCKIQLVGEVKYPLHQHTLKPFSSLGLSNTATGRFKIINDETCFIFPIPLDEVNQ